MNTATKHSRSIEKDEGGEYAYSCSCKTVYVSRLESFKAAVARDKAHKAAVADGTWQAEIDAEAARLAELAPLHAAIREHADLVSDYRSLGFEALIERQAGRSADEILAKRAEVGRAVEAVAAKVADLKKIGA